VHKFEYSVNYVDQQKSCIQWSFRGLHW